MFLNVLDVDEIRYLRCWDQSAASWAVSSSSFPPGCHRDQPCPCGWPETWTAECSDSHLALSPMETDEKGKLKKFKINKDGDINDVYLAPSTLFSLYYKL